MKLKPCPHCGSKARFTQYLDPDDYKFYIAVVCTNPDCKAQSRYDTVRAKTARAWNKRVGESE